MSDDSPEEIDRKILSGVIVTIESLRDLADHGRMGQESATEHYLISNERHDELLQAVESAAARLKASILDGSQYAITRRDILDWMDASVRLRGEVSTMGNHLLTIAALLAGAEQTRTARAPSGERIEFSTQFKLNERGEKEAPVVVDGKEMTVTLSDAGVTAKGQIKFTYAQAKVAVLFLSSMLLGHFLPALLSIWKGHTP